MCSSHSPAGSDEHEKNTSWGNGGNSFQQGKNCKLEGTWKLKAETGHQRNCISSVGKRVRFCTDEHVSQPVGKSLQTGAGRASALKSCATSTSGRRGGAASKGSSFSCASILSDSLRKYEKSSAQAGGQDESAVSLVAARVMDGPAGAAPPRSREHPVVVGIQGETENPLARDTSQRPSRTPFGLGKASMDVSVKSSTGHGKTSSIGRTSKSSSQGGRDNISSAETVSSFVRDKSARNTVKNSNAPGGEKENYAAEVSTSCNKAKQKLSSIKVEKSGIPPTGASDGHSLTARNNHSLITGNSRGNCEVDRGRGHTQGDPTPDLATVLEVGARDSKDGQETMTIDFPDGAVGASREKSRTENSDKSPRNGVRSVDVQKGSEPDRQPDESIYVLDPKTGNRLPTKPVSARVPTTISRQVVRGRKGPYLEEIDQVVGGEVSLNRKGSWTWAQIFSGPRATRTLEVKTLVDTGSPATFIQRKVWDKMMKVGAATIEGTREIDPVSWGGFNGVPLCTSSQVRLNIRLWPRKRNPHLTAQDGRACLAMYAHVVPDGTMNYDILIGRDGLGLFPVRTYRDVNQRETVMTLHGENHDSVSQTFTEHVQNAVGFVEQEASAPQVVVVYNGTHETVRPDTMSWVPVKLFNMDGTPTVEGSYYATLDPEWSPREIIIDAG